MGGNSSDPAAAGSTSAEPSPPLLASSFILVAALPFISISGYAYLYTALPLHVFDSGWPLWHLSILLSVCFVFRLLMSAAVTRLGYWAMVLNAAAMVPLTLFMVISPGNLTFVYIGVFSACTAISTNTYRSLVYEEFHSNDSDWRLQRALRWFTLFDTVGYSFGPFIGGALYDAGRFRLCSQFQLATQIACVVLPLFLTKVQASISSAFSDAARLCLSLRRLPRRSTGIVPDAHPAVEGAVESTTSRAHFSPDPASTKQESPLPIWPIAVILISAFTNIAVYGVEWCLYAIYFRSVFGWSGAAIGAAQMAGDLLGGLVLALSTMSCVTRAAGCFCHASPNFARALLRPPFGIALLLGCHGLLMVLLAQSQFGVALVGQILMGTVYVFCEQLVQEMLVVYSVGSHEKYKRLVFWHYIFFCGGACACAPIAVSLFELLGFANTFYTAAVWASVSGVAFAAFFAARFARTAEGILGKYDAAEAELRGC